MLTLPNASNAALLVVDVQERLYAVMPPAERASALRAAANLRGLFVDLGLPVVTTQQYTRGLGPTVPELASDHPVEKMTFSAADLPEVRDGLAGRHVVVVGMEAHICVALTALGLRAQGSSVSVVSDGCVSRNPDDKAAAYAQLRAAGVGVLPHETLGFAVLGRAGTAEFKAFSARIR